MSEESRAPVRNPVVPALYGFRAYAILGVVALHLLLLAGALDPGTDFSLVAWGVLGNIIDTFFIISGFVLFLRVAMRGSLGPRRDFAFGRAVRLVPGYWLCLGLMLVLIALLPNPVGSAFPNVAYPDPLEVLGTMAGLQMPIRLIDGSFPIGFGLNGALWMISIIAGFYVVLAFVAGAYRRHPLLGLALAAAVTFGWKQWILLDPSFFEWLDRSDGPLWAVELIATDQLPGWAFSFALGMTGAWAYAGLVRDGKADRFRGRATVAAAAGLAACGICAYLYGAEASSAASPVIGGSTARNDPALAIAFSAARAVLMAGIVLGPLWMRKPFESRASERIAELSFGVYLIHLVASAYVGEMILGLPNDGTLLSIAAWFGVVLPVSFVYAHLSLRYVERPVRRWLERRRDRRSSAALPMRPSPVR